MGEETYVTPVAAAAAASINFTGGGDSSPGKKHPRLVAAGVGDPVAKMSVAGKTRMIGLPYAEESMKTC